MSISDRSARGRPVAVQAPGAEPALADQTVAITGAGNASFSRYATAGPAAAGRMPRPRIAPPSGADVAIGAALASVGAQRVARAVDTSGAVFNPGSLAHDLRRAIDQSDVTDGWVMEGMASHPTTRRVDAALVMRVLDGLTQDQIAQVEKRYAAQEGTTLRQDLFGQGQSGARSNLEPDQRARIEALLKGTAPSGPQAPDARLEAVAIELHELLSGGPDEAQKERVMSLLRRPLDQLAAIDGQYERHYGHHPTEDIVRHFTGIELVRVTCLRAGDVARADALAIDSKRRALGELEAKRRSGRLGIPGMAGYQEDRERLIDGITAIAETNRDEALADHANAGKPAAEATKERLTKIMAIPVAAPGRTLADELAVSLKGTAAAGVMTAMTSGAPVQTAARRLVEMEARHTTSSAKIAELVRGLREQAEHDVVAGIPQLSREELEAFRANPSGHKAKLVADRAAEWIKAFTEAYDQLRPADGRPWAAIHASAASENQEMLDALTAGAGELATVDTLRFAIRRKDAAQIKAVLRTLRTKEDVDALDRRYRLKFGDGLRDVLLGALGTAAAEYEDAPSDAVVRGRDAAQVGEYLAAPAKGQLGTVDEVDLIAKHGLHEVAVTEANSGSIGDLRELGKLPETQRLMHDSATELRGLQKAFKDNAANPTLQAAILAEMKLVRATLDGDASAYQDENAEIRAQVRSAVSLAVQVTLALALPGVGAGMSGFIATTVVNIGANVASNLVIYGDQYNLSRLYDDVIGGGLGALGGKLGEDVARLVTQQVAGTVAAEAVRIATAAGKSPKLVAEAGRAAALATEARLSLRALAEAGNIAGATGATSVATGNDGFTAEGILQSFLMNRLAHLRSGGASAGHGEHALAPPADAHGDAAHAAPAPDGAGHPLEPGGSGGSAAGRPASAAERLEARASWRKLEQLGSQWPSLGDAARCAGVADIANDMLGLRDAPSVRVVPGKSAPGGQGSFDFKEWVIRLDPALVGAPSMPPELVAFVSDLSRHESEHVLQWWTMARLRASQGATAQQVAAEMYIPLDVAEHAVRTVKQGGMGVAEQAAGQAWWNSVYSPSTTRNADLTQRTNERTELARLDAEIDTARRRGETVDRAKLFERDELRERVAGLDALYHGLPEERGAFAQGAIAGNEAKLQQLELEADLATIALEHAVADLKVVEHEFLTQIAAENPAAPALAAQHAAGVARVKLLHERADAARAKHDAMADTIAPPLNLRADQPSDTQTAMPRHAAEPSNGPPVAPEGHASASTPARPPKPEPPERADDPEGKRKSYASLAELRPALMKELQAAHAAGELERNQGAARTIVGLVAEIRKTDPAFADRVQRYFDAIENPAFLEEKMAKLWEQAAVNERTTAGETEHILGGGTPAVNTFSNTPGIHLFPKRFYAEFQTAIRDPRAFVDESFAGDFHGSHIHAFHEYLGDCLFGPGEGRKFRQRLADLTGPSKTLPTGVEQPFWSQVWDTLFDGRLEDGLHSPEALGKILQEHLGYPKRAPQP